jgi:hypothetical protein
MTLKKKIGLLKGKIEKQITKQKWKKKTQNTIPVSE